MPRYADRQDIPDWDDLSRRIVRAALAGMIGNVLLLYLVWRRDAIQFSRIVMGFTWPDKSLPPRRFDVREPQGPPRCGRASLLDGGCRAQCPGQLLILTCQVCTPRR